ncbi:CRISPR locus-related DNA-binding protein [Candidatus Woesearchaeota archaeon]|nr:CRISPR locus-related DNA-binding protein [Candidatus Woesearchaeota archaeon]
MGNKVLIATLYSPDPVLLAANRLGPDRLILLLDKKSNKEQDTSFKLIKESLGRVVDVKSVKTDVYNIVEIAKNCVDIIDMQPKDDEIFINITSGRKTKALGLLYAAYARCDRIRKIAYNPEEDKTSVVYLPKLCFKLTESQKKVLEGIDDRDNAKLSLIELAERIGISRAMLYRNIDELRDMDYVITEDGLKLTDAGKIARL